MKTLNRRDRGALVEVLTRARAHELGLDNAHLATAIALTDSDRMLTLCLVENEHGGGIACAWEHGSAW